MYPGVGTFVLIRPTQTFYERIKLVSLCRTVGSTLFDMWRRSSYTHPGGCGGSCRFSPIGLRPTFQRSGEFCHKVVHLLCAMEQALQPLGRFPLLRRAAAPSPDVAVLCVVRQGFAPKVHVESKVLGLNQKSVVRNSETSIPNAVEKTSATTEPDHVVVRVESELERLSVGQFDGEFSIIILIEVPAKRAIADTHSIIASF